MLATGKTPVTSCNLCKLVVQKNCPEDTLNVADYMISHTFAAFNTIRTNQTAKRSNQHNHYYTCLL